MNNLNEQINYINEMNKLNYEVLERRILKYKRSEFILKLLISSSIGTLIGLAIFNLFIK